LITIFLVLASVHKCQTGFSLANISFTQNENASWSTLFKGNWSQDISEEIKFILLCSFSKTIPKWPVILPKVLLIFIWYAVNYLHYCWVLFWLLYILPLSCIICYLTNCSFHPILYIGMLMLCLFALSDFIYMHFGAFIISFIKYYVCNSKLLCACNRYCCAVDPHDLSPTLCDSNTTSIC